MADNSSNKSMNSGSERRTDDEFQGNPDRENQDEREAMRGAVTFGMPNTENEFGSLLGPSTAAKGAASGNLLGGKGGVMPAPIDYRMQESEMHLPKAMGSEYLKQDVTVIEYEKLKMTPKAVEEKILEILRSFRVRYRRKHEDFRATGCYVFKGEICEFECQLWMLKSGVVGHELRRKGTQGRCAYRNLVQMTAWELKKEKLAEKFASGNEILMPLTVMEEKYKGLNQELFGWVNEDEKTSDSEISDCDDEMEIPGPPSMSISFLGSDTGIKLTSEADILKIWKNILASNNYSHKADTLIVMTRASRKKENAAVLAGDRNILHEVVAHLKGFVSAQVIHSATELISNIVNSGNNDAIKILTSMDIMQSLINVAYVFTSCYSKTIGLDQQKQKPLKKLQANSVVAQNAVKTITDMIKLSKDSAQDSILSKWRKELSTMLEIVSKKTAKDKELEDTLAEFEKALAS